MEISGALPQHAFQSVAILGGLDLAAVGAAHGRDRVSAHEGALHQVYLAPVLKRLRREGIRAKACVAHVSRHKDALVAEVVDREDRSGAPEGAAVLIQFLYIKGDERRLPVIAVNDVGPEIQGAAELNNSAREEDEPFGIVAIVAARRSVEFGAVEINVLADEIGRHAPGTGARQHIAALLPGPEGDREGRGMPQAEA